MYREKYFANNELFAKSTDFWVEMMRVRLVASRRMKRYFSYIL